MLLLSNDDIEQVITVPAVMDALETAYRDLANGEATNVPRVDTLVPHPTREGAVHAFKTMAGSWPRERIAALRLNSDIVQWPTGSGQGRVREKVPLSPGGTYNGMVQLFSTDTGELLAMFPDGVLQRTRVGATNGLAARYLAREDAKVVALIGSGWQAGTQLLAVSEARDLDLVKVFSPTPANRARFAEEMGPQVGAEVRAVDSAEAAVEDADIIMLSTNSLEPVLREDWIRPGVLVTSIRGTEVADEHFARFDDVVVHSQQVVQAFPAEALRTTVPEFTRGEYKHSTSQGFDLANTRTLPQVVADPTLGRRSDQDAIVFHNFCGLGLQFAAAGSAVYRAALGAGLGNDLPIEWFVQHVHP